MRSRAPSRERVIDFTPDWVVTRKKRGRMGTPISKRWFSWSAKKRKELTEWFCLVALIVFPQSEFHDGIWGEIFFDEVFPPGKLEFLLDGHERRKRRERKDTYILFGS